jgi:fatty-acyl-CoA synthase
MHPVPIHEQLTIPGLLAYAAENHCDTEIVTREISGSIERYTYAQAEERARRLASSLQRLGHGPGSRLASLAWNTRRHFELFYAVPGIGAALHTVNPRLFKEQIGFILDDAQDVCLFLDLETLELAQAVLASAPRIVTCIVMAHEHEMPQESLPGMLCYETLVEQGDPAFEWPELDEHLPAVICYTSGTTGDPKGVVYTHRTVVLQSLIGSFANMPGSANGEQQVLLSLAPMFHANAWNFPFIGPLTGAKLVFPGRDMRPESIYELLEGEKVTRAAGVPSIWLILVDWMTAHGKRLSTLRQAFGAGSTLPPHLIKHLMEEHRLEVTQSWGMTEVPNASSGTLKPGHNRLSTEQQMERRSSSGRAIFGTRLRIVDGEGRVLPRDGTSVGHLRVKGLWSARGYLNRPGDSALDADGWLITGDLATLDQDGYMRLVDRSKDVIKSGGEWISSIQLEKIAATHPAVQQAAAIAMPHEKWSERPMLLVVRKPGTNLSAAEVLEHMKPQLARWWLPDSVVFVDALPTTATGKLNKAELRRRFAPAP